MSQGGVANWYQYPHWARGPAQIIGDEIVLDENRAQPYFLYEPRELMFDFAELAADLSNLDPRRAMAFVRRYGLLWHGAEDMGSGKCREPLRDWWIQSHMFALTADLYVRLKEAVKTGSAEQLRTSPLDFMKAIEGGDPEDDQFCIEAASLYLAEAISFNLKGSHLGVSASLGLDIERRGPLTFLLTQNPPNLVAAAYAQLAMAMVNRAPMVECQGCGRMFIPESGKQKYCTKSCASTSRWRRWKERQSVD
jgi:hypothetical protein